MMGNPIIGLLSCPGLDRGGINVSFRLRWPDTVKLSDFELRIAKTNAREENEMSERKAC
jgi:hypothetical protein